MANEDDGDYLVRVELLSRDAAFGDADTLKKHYCFVLAINGLRDTNLRVELTVERGLDWKRLKRLFEARSVTRLAIDILVSNCGGVTPIKRWVCSIYNNTKSSKYKASVMKPL